MRKVEHLAVALAVGTAVIGSAAGQERSRSIHIIEQAPEMEPLDSTPAAPDRQKKGGVVSIETFPQRQFKIGDPMYFRVTTQKQGYLVLVDVDAGGKLFQIYPNMVSLSDPRGVDENSNYIRAGTSITLPDARTGTFFRFIASPPVGVGMVVAILSDTPVQVIDLPDVPAALAGSDAAADFVVKTTRSLQILPAGTTTVSTRKPKWVFGTQFYSVR